MSEQAVNELIEEIEKEIARRKRGAALTIEASPKDDEKNVCVGPATNSSRRQGVGRYARRTGYGSKRI